MPPNLPKPHGADVWKIGKQRGRSGSVNRNVGICTNSQMENWETEGPEWGEAEEERQR